MSAHRFSRIAAGARVGVDWFWRAGLARDDLPAPRGLVTRFEALASPRARHAAVSPAVRAFFEDTAALELHVRSRWRWPFSWAWRASRWLFTLVGQLRMPLDEARVDTRIVALDAAREGRDDARGVVRTTDGGEVFQVFAYGVTSDGAMSVAIPWPGGHLAGLLRLDVEGRAVTLSSRADGVWFVTPRASLRLPLEETLRFWPADDPDAPRDRAWPDATLVCRHEQRLFGAVVVEHTHTFRPQRANTSLPKRGA